MPLTGSDRLARPVDGRAPERGPERLLILLVIFYLHQSSYGPTCAIYRQQHFNQHDQAPVLPFPLLAHPRTQLPNG